MGCLISYSIILNVVHLASYFCFKDRDFHGKAPVDTKDVFNVIKM